MPFIAPTPTKPQAIQRPSFVPPPLDGSCTVVEAYDWHLVHSPDHEFYKYQEPGGAIRTVTWKEATLAVYRAADLVITKCAAEKPCFAVLAVADTITYSTLAMGIIRAGFAPFLPSPRVSPEVLAQLLSAAGITHVFHSRDTATTNLLATSGVAVKRLPLPTFSDLFDGTLAPPPPSVKPHMHDAAAIIHSSGSTSVPKILPVSFATLFMIGISPWCNDIDCGSLTTNYAVVPMYHLFGLTHFPLAAYTGTTMHSLQRVLFYPFSVAQKELKTHWTRCRL